MVCDCVMCSFRFGLLVVDWVTVWFEFDLDLVGFMSLGRIVDLFPGLLEGVAILYAC